MTMLTSRRVLCASVGAAILALTTGPAAFAADKIEAVIATVNAATFLIPRLEQRFADLVAEKTDGGLVIEVVTDGQLGGMKENIEAVMAGNLEMCQVNNAFLGSLYSGTMLFDLPFVFRDNDHMRKVVRGEIGQEVYGAFEEQTGIKLILTGLADGPRSVWNRTRAVRTPGDLEGLKLRVMESPLMVDTFTALGAIPTPMAYPEVYMAAKQGVIDGAETPPSGLIDMKAPEIATYYSLTQHFAMPSAVAVNAAWYDSLPQEYKDAMNEAEAEAAAWYDTTYDADNEKALVTVQEEGMEVNQVEDPEAFRAAVKPVYEKYADRVGGMAAIERVLETE